MNCYALRVNLSVGIVCMVNHTATKEEVNQSIATPLPSNHCDSEGSNDTDSIPEVKIDIF